MKSIKNIYKIGYGPSSSHTMGPAFATSRFMTENPEADFIKVILYGSLAKTGKGHGTDRAIIQTLADIPYELVWDLESETPLHPNTLEFIAFKDEKEIARKQFYSIGGGEIKAQDDSQSAYNKVYEEKSFSEIAALCKAKNVRLSDYVFEREDKDFKKYLLSVWQDRKSVV